jgi:hypothetical protein
MGALGSNNILNSFTGISQGQANIIAEQVTTVGADSIAGQMSFVGVNYIFNSVSSVTNTTANLVASSMSATGANDVASLMTTSSGVTSMVSQFSTANCNTIASGITSSGSASILQNAGPTSTINSRIPIVSNTSPTGGTRLSIIRGGISGGSSPSITTGEGFTLNAYTAGSGIYSVSWSNSLIDTPAVTANIVSGTLNTGSEKVTVNPTSTGAIFYVTDSSGTGVNFAFNFIAIGKCAS